MKIKHMLMLLSLMLITLLLPTHAKAEPICTSWGYGLNVCLPLSSVQGAYGYNLNAKDGEGNQALLETPFATIKDKIAFTFGGAKSAGQEASPFVSATYGITNPVTNEGNPLSWIRPGVYGGKNFNSREWIYGFKASAQLW